MKLIPAILAVCLPAIVVSAQGANPAGSMINARTVYHDDGTRSESIKDPLTRMFEEKTFNANGVLISRTVYQMNEQGQVTMGMMYDGRGTLQARSMTYFDEYGRIKESRMSNMQGEVFQQTIHEYEPGGKAKRPKVINYNVKSPTMRPQMIDFTQSMPPPDTRQPAGAQAQGTRPAQPQEPEKPKKSIWKRMFGGKDKK